MSRLADEAMNEYFDVPDIATAQKEKEKEKEMDLYHLMRKAAQADKQHIITLEQQLSEREKQAVLLRDSLREQITLLRGVFQLYIEEHEEFTDENNWTAMACSLEAHHIAKEAFHQPDVQAYSAGELVELARVVIKQLNLTADADDLRQYILCEKEPVGEVTGVDDEWIHTLRIGTKLYRARSMK